MSNLAAFVLALSAISFDVLARNFEEDEQLLIQARVTNEQPPGFKYALGDKVHVQGYDDKDNVTVIGYGGGTDRYHLLMKGVGELRNIAGGSINRPTTTPPPFADPAAGPVDYILGFEYRAKPVITGRGEKPGTWNVHIDGMGEIPNVDDASIIRAKSWHLTSSTPSPQRSNLEKLMELRKVRNNSTRAKAEEKRRFSISNMIENRKDAAAKARLLTEQLEAAHMLPTKAPEAAELAQSQTVTAVAPPASTGETAAVIVPEKPSAAQLQLVLPNNVADPVEIPLTGPAAEFLESGNAQAVGDAGNVAQDGRDEAQPEELMKGQLTFDLELGEAEERGFTTLLAKGSGHLQALELDIASIKEGGALAAWNAKALPSARVREGDRILSINGVAGNALKLHKELQNLPNSSQTLSVVVERKVAFKPEVTAQQAIDALKELSVVGPKGYLKKNLPFSLGRVLINDKETVHFCSDISSPLYCQNSHKTFGIHCAGWGGQFCLSTEHVKCSNMKNPTICREVQSKFGITCAGWGGSSCLAKKAHPSLITSEHICQHSEKRLDIESAGWGGSSCLAKDAKCSQITAPGICNDAASRLGLSCLGWGGSSCLDAGAEAEAITDEGLCAKSTKRFGIKSVGWSGHNCISPGKLRCDVIKEPNICSNSMNRLNISCAGWGGHACLDHNVPVALISSPAICQHSKEVLGIPSAGWSGTHCMEPGNVQCSHITAPGVCNDAQKRLGINCAGWSGNKCLSKEEAKCSMLTSQLICLSSKMRLGLPCVWNGQFCLPELH